MSKNSFVNHLDKKYLLNSFYLPVLLIIDRDTKKK